METIAAVQAAVEPDRRMTIEKLAAEFDMSVGTVHKILHEDLGLSKKSAGWVPRLLSMEQKAQCVCYCKNVKRLWFEKARAFEAAVVMMDESLV